jgi:hypothetical protein
MGDMKRPGMVIETRTSDTRNRELVVSSTGQQVPQRQTSRPYRRRLVRQRRCERLGYDEEEKTCLTDTTPSRPCVCSDV